jgi:hypothetical protein
MPQMVARLLSARLGGDPNVRTRDGGRTAVHVACAFPSTTPADADRRLAVLNMLLAWCGPAGPADLNAVDFEGECMCV